MTNPLQQDRRLVILRHLLESAKYTSNDSIIDTTLDAWGHCISRDVVVGELHWLAEQGLIIIKPLDNNFIVTLTQRGIDVAEGQAIHPGVKRPRP